MTDVIARLREENERLRQDMATVEAACAHWQEEVGRLGRQEDGAYSERDKLVAALSKYLPSYLGRHEASDLEWEDNWRWIVFIETPQGQCSWHIHDDELPMFAHLERRGEGCWDGHTTEDKYRRLAALTPSRGSLNG